MKTQGGNKDLLNQVVNASQYEVTNAIRLMQKLTGNLLTPIQPRVAQEFMKALEEGAMGLQEMLICES